MTEFEKWDYYYSKGWATKDQLKIVVQCEKITPDEYEEITGEPYSE
jgi:hypothetical protein